MLGAIAIGQSAAIAGPFDGINRVLNTVNRVDHTINYTNATVRSLSNTLGLDGDSYSRSVSDEDPTGQVLELYNAWYTSLEADQQAMVGSLVMEYASGREVDFQTISSSDWFTQKARS